MQSCLWSYDISVIDPQKAKKLIITQAINHGDARQLGWVTQHYSDEEIREVVTNPARGVWWREKLRLWLGKYGVMIDPLKYELAIREITLKPISLAAEFFKRVEKDTHAGTRAQS